MKRYLAADTWGMCDMRGIRGPFASIALAVTAAASLEKPAEPWIAMDKKEHDPGTTLKKGDWCFAQGGLVYGPFENMEAAQKDYAETIADANGALDGGGVVYYGPVVEIVSRYKGNGKVTAVILEVEVA